MAAGLQAMMMVERNIKIGLNHAQSYGFTMCKAKTIDSS